MRRVSTHASGDAETRRRALAMLQRVARRAHGIMRRHGWVVDELTELPPPRGRAELWGDNLNRGERVRLLLRSNSGRRGAVRWMDEDQVFATFLHELAHMEIGPHDARFYALLETLKDEAALRMASDFIVCGRCVGGGAGASRATSPRNAAARAAARRRETARRPSESAPPTGRRLGGASTSYVRHHPPNSRRAAEDRARRAAARGSNPGETNSRDVVVID